MADNANENSEIDVQKVMENNAKLVQMAQNQADVITELRQLNSDKELRIAELSATVKRFQQQVQAAVAAEQAVEEDKAVDEGVEDEQE
tara:strand:- start:421 stop:684 length:264 start_codon:yes stop_codon:yes gene_type:complete